MKQNSKKALLFLALIPLALAAAYFFFGESLFPGPEPVKAGRSVVLDILELLLGKISPGEPGSVFAVADLDVQAQIFFGYCARENMPAVRNRKMDPTGGQNGFPSGKAEDSRHTVILRRQMPMLLKQVKNQRVCQFLSPKVREKFAVIFDDI